MRVRCQKILCKFNFMNTLIGIKAKQKPGRVGAYELKQTETISANGNLNLNYSFFGVGV